MSLIVTAITWRTEVLSAVREINNAMATDGPATAVTQAQLRMARQRLKQALEQIDEDALNGSEG